MKLNSLTIRAAKLAVIMMAAGHSASPLAAQEAVQQLEEVQVRADYDRAVDGVFLPDVQGTKIHAGKKTSNIDLEQIPEISMDNYRQVIAKTPGLILAEENTPLLSIGYRGYDPHRTQYFQVLEDGIPIHADMIGYPEAYYTPPLDAVESVEIVRGGAALMYGPQPAGAINFVMKKPPLDTPFTIESTNILGSFDMYSNFTSFGGTVGKFGYYGYYDHQQTQGFREANSDFFLNAWGGTFALDATGPFRTYLNITAYDETHGEPGGLTLEDGPNAVNYETDRYGTSRFHDRMRVSRYATSLINEWDISETTLATFRTWWNYYLRFSRRQNGGGFGTLPTGPKSQTNEIQNQQFYNFGFEPRLSHNWEWLDNTHTLSGGMMFYYDWSPRTDQTGNSPTAMSGTTINQSNRESVYYSLFAENLFQFGNLSITPGFRLENIWQSVRELVNTSSFQTGNPLQDETNYNFAPLFGLGVEYDFTPEVAIYANVSQAYRPPIFTQAVPTSANTQVAGNLEESTIVNYEVGFQGEPTSWLTWDTSFFLIDNSDQIGTRAVDQGQITTIIENAGRSVVYGWDLYTELDFIGLADATWNKEVATKSGAKKSGSWVDRYGSLSAFTALTLQSGEFINGPNQGNTPQYLSDYILRLGLTYNWRDRVKLALLGNFVGDSNASDNNASNRFIPAYSVWDLTAEAKVWRDTVSVIAGVNNLFGADYYARIRADGIDPAAPTNWYAGIKVEF
ncbi:MAG: TonB-dependent receptor [Verrucomicrobia bacterium]|nr:TonB-dependent receptor [Verrucomicrobiota bacterium]